MSLKILNIFSKSYTVITTCAAKSRKTSQYKLPPALSKDTVNLSHNFTAQTAKVINLKTGKKETITFQKGTSKRVPMFCDIIEACNKEGKVVGKAAFRPSVINFLLPPNKHAIHLEYIGTNGNYRGIGKALIKQIVQTSRAKGLGGKIYLQAITGAVPNDFRFAGYSKKCKQVSAAIQYKKMGFKAEYEKMDKLLDAEIQKGDNGLESITQFGKELTYDKYSGVMYLPEEAIQKYLHP